MGEVADATSAALKQLQTSLDLLHGVVAGVDTAQQQMRAQLDHQAAAISDSATKHDDTARILQSLMAKLHIGEAGAPDKPPEEVEPDPGEAFNSGHSTLHPAKPRWMGNTAGASTSTGAHGGGFMAEGERGMEGFLGGVGGGGGGGIGGGRTGGAGGGGLGGAGGGGLGGAGGGRHHQANTDNGSRSQMPKMNFPRFSGEHPRIWRDQCLDYFRVFNISPMLWLTTATLHLDGNAAVWLQAYKQRHELSGWPQFITAVEAEFGGDDQRKFMKTLLQLKQTGSVNEYIVEFQRLVYQVSMFNPHYDTNFFISQFIQGLKFELRGSVESHIPDTLERAYLIAKVQQELLDDTPKKMQRQYGRSETTVGKFDMQPKPALKFATGDLWKDRQLRDYRRANGLCFKCGEQYDPTHVCGQKQAATLNAMEDGEGPVLLAEEVLNMLELQDVAEAQLLSLSIHAMAGSEGAETLRLRAMVGNQVFIILVDSGSSSSFIHSHLLTKTECEVQTVPSIAVKVANCEYLYSTQMVPEFTWWSHGTTFVTPMRVLDLGAYDAILGMVWLKRHSPMTTD